MFFYESFSKKTSQVLLDWHTSLITDSIVSKPFVFPIKREECEIIPIKNRAMIYIVIAINNFRLNTAKNYKKIEIYFFKKRK